MAIVKNTSSGKQIRTLLLVLGSGIAAAFIFALAMLNYYNPTGSYLAKNVLLAPENTFSMHYKEGKENIPFVFDAVEFSYFHPTKKQWQHLSIDLQKYQEFFASVSNDASLSDVSDATKSLFLQGHPAILTVHTRIEGKSASSQPFLQVIFAETGNDYRIQLRQQSPVDGWAYFYHPEIYQKILTLFTET